MLRARNTQLFKLTILFSLILQLSGCIEENQVPESVTDLSALQGDWYLVGGSNPDADGMHVKISEDKGYVLNPSNTSLQNNDVKWQDIKATSDNTFSHQELGSDRNYYDGAMELQGDTLYVTVFAAGAGNRQTWVRNPSSSADKGLEKLQGDWFRTSSSNATADGMQVTVEDDQAKVVDKASSGYSEGDVLWSSLVNTGNNVDYRLQVLGSDGKYYDASLTLENDSTISITIDAGGAGSKQTWINYTPEVNEPSKLQGDWFRSSSTNTGADGMQVKVENDQAQVVDQAGSGYAIGDILWQSLTNTGNDIDYDLEVLGSDGNYYPATLTLENDSTLNLSITSSGTGSEQTWVRSLK